MEAEGVQRQVVRLDEDDGGDPEPSRWLRVGNEEQEAEIGRSESLVSYTTHLLHLHSTAAWPGVHGTNIDMRLSGLGLDGGKTVPMYYYNMYISSRQSRGTGVYTYRPATPWKQHCTGTTR